jgi:hypothetical protein
MVGPVSTLSGNSQWPSSDGKAMRSGHCSCQHGLADSTTPLRGERWRGTGAQSIDGSERWPLLGVFFRGGGMLCPVPRPERSMASFTELPELVGFFSYSREDDEDSKGRLSVFREAIGSELAQHLGRSRRKDFRLWQDQVAIATGDAGNRKSPRRSGKRRSSFSSSRRALLQASTASSNSSRSWRGSARSAAKTSSSRFSMSRFRSCWTRRNGATIRYCLLSASANTSIGVRFATSGRKRRPLARRSRAYASRSQRSCASLRSYRTSVGR